VPIRIHQKYRVRFHPTDGTKGQESSRYANARAKILSNNLELDNHQLPWPHYKSFRVAEKTVFVTISRPNQLDVLEQFGMGILCPEIEVAAPPLGIETGIYGNSLDQSGFSKSVFPYNKSYVLAQSQFVQIDNRRNTIGICYTSIQWSVVSYLSDIDHIFFMKQLCKQMRIYSQNYYKSLVLNDPFFFQYRFHSTKFF
jgi:hypothetical protein